ncbi:MAG: hypothetical protein ACJ8G4_07190, partial [Burkholderiales bacterium]
EVVLVGEGERIPAVAVLIGGDALSIDESALTGESVPVAKRRVNSSSDEADVDAEPGGENTPHLFSGTLVVRGQGVARIVRTGAATRLGRIGVSLAAIESEPMLLQQNTARLIAKLGMMAFAFCALVVVAYGLLRGDWSRARWPASRSPSPSCPRSSRWCWRSFSRSMPGASPATRSWPGVVR